MSIMMCGECDRLVDTDYEEMYDIKDNGETIIICDVCADGVKDMKLEELQDKLEEIRIACGGDEGFMVTSCCGYELMYKKVGQYSFELWDFCGMCLKSSWEPITEEDYLKDNSSGRKNPRDMV